MEDYHFRGRYHGIFIHEDLVTGFYLDQFMPFPSKRRLPPRPGEKKMSASILYANWAKKATKDRQISHINVVRNLEVSRRLSKDCFA